MASREKYGDLNDAGWPDLKNACRPRTIRRKSDKDGSGRVASPPARGGQRLLACSFPVLSAPEAAT
eukprot:CAMPEP_0170607626 /NCGR_PEP_ID=MMETSP0224-20130122/21154_1 /TAXON_ID=285029 /ORGANISM="Togula jolla, Strain CCCM 725" /LENGTH=65 /DNA_ID=CAMNT_0010932803 /DNA_START=317 /DNA_END=510 /DNA_ORIENTATION=-